MKKLSYFTSFILIAAVVSHLIQIGFHVAGDQRYDHAFALSLEGLQKGRFWQLFTYQFLHGGLLHLTLNSITLLSFGYYVEERVGSVSMAAGYFSGVILGGVIQVVVLKVTQTHTEAIIVGASAGIMAEAAMYTVLSPDTKVVMLPIPISVKLSTAMAIFSIISVTGVAFPKFLGFIGHGAHLGGIISGFLFISLWFNLTEAGATRKRNANELQILLNTVLNDNTGKQTDRSD